MYLWCDLSLGFQFFVVVVIGEYLWEALGLLFQVSDGQKKNVWHLSYDLVKF